MKIIVLFTVPTIGKQITSDLRWFSNNKPLITDMEDEHIKNARCWMHRQLRSLKDLGYNEPINNGFTYSEWLAILGTEEKRRVAIIKRNRQNEIERLRLKTLSEREKKSKAAKLLANSPTDADIARAKQILGIVSEDNDCSGFDHADTAFESELSYHGY